MSPPDAFQLLFESNPLPMWVYDEESLAFLEVNEAAVAAYGYSREEFLAMTLRDIRPAEELGAFLAQRRRDSESFRRAGIWRHRRKDGELLDMELNLHTLRHRGRPAVLAVAVDVTERLKAEAQLQQSASGALILAEAARVFAEAPGEEALMQALFSFARCLVPLPHWWRIRFDLGESLGRSTDWSPSLAPLFGPGGPRLPVAAGRRSLVERLFAERATVHLPDCAEGASGAEPLPRTLLALPMSHREQIVGALLGASFGEEGLRGIEPYQVQDLEQLVGTANLAIDRLRAQESREASERRYRRLFERNLAGVFRTAPDGRILDCNPAFAEILGYSREEVLNLNAGSFYFSSGDRGAYLERLRIRGALNNLEVRLRRKDGAAIWALENVNLLPAEDGQGEALEGTLIDITALKRAEELERGQRQLLAMVARNEPLAKVLEQLAALVEGLHPALRCSILLLHEGRLLVSAAGSLPPDFSAAVEGVEPGPQAGACGTAVFRREAVFCDDIATDERWPGPVRELALARGLRACWSWPVLGSNGEALGAFALYCGEARGPQGEELDLLETAGRLAAVALEHQFLTGRLAYQAHHDALTGLPNRVLFSDRLGLAIAQARRNQRQVAVLFIDLDGFKHVNDSLGHAAGDALLKQVAARFTGLVRASDTLARMGGDEFTIVLHDLKDSRGGVRVAQKLLDSLKQPLLVEGRELRVGASIGVAFYPQDAEDAATLQRHADAAMYRAKGLGKNTFQCFTAELQSRLDERLELENSLHEALRRDEFVLYYQPQFGLDGGLQGFEALVRWRHPRLGLVPPSKFIPVAEESGFIVPLGRWALEEACRRAARWREEGRRGLRVSVNVSPVQFAQKDWVDIVAELVARYALPPQALELELTEGLVMQRPAEAAQRLAQLRELGQAIAIDDFGTGYSSLSYLHRLPLDTLKIDQSFVRELDGGQAGTSVIVQSIVALARSMDLRVVAEGVETEAQRALLSELAIDGFQGYLLGRPQSPEDCERYFLS